MRRNKAEKTDWSWRRMGKKAEKKTKGGKEEEEKKERDLGC